MVCMHFCQHLTTYIDRHAPGDMKFEFLQAC
jgi:hypothetical protein